MEDGQFNQARKRLETAVFDFYCEINPSFTKETKERTVLRVVQSTMERLK